MSARSAASSGGGMRMGDDVFKLDTYLQKMIDDPPASQAEQSKWEAWLTHVEAEIEDARRIFFSSPPRYFNRIASRIILNLLENRRAGIMEALLTVPDLTPAQVLKFVTEGSFVKILPSKAAQPFRRSNERARVGSAGTWPAGREGRAVKKPSATARRTQPLAP